jgi:hypothetical protein
LVYLGGDEVKEPGLEIDRQRLMRVAAGSGMLPDISSVQGPLTYILFADDAGKIVGMERLRGPKIPTVESELMRVRVTSAAMKGRVPVPFAV